MFKPLLILSAFICFCDRVSAEEVDTDSILEKADSFRNPSQEFSMNLMVVNGSEESEFEVYLKGTDKTLIVVKKPAKNMGRNMLMLDRDFYVYVPNLKRGVRLSLAQKLMGQVANGDIARTRWHRDYKAQLLRSGKSEIELQLDATKPNLTYQKIHVYLAKKDNRPLKAEFLSVDGRTVLKTASYLNYASMAGGERPLLIEISQPGSPPNQIKIFKMESRTIPDKAFNIERLDSPSIQ